MEQIIIMSMTHKEVKLSLKKYSRCFFTAQNFLLLGSKKLFPLCSFNKQTFACFQATRAMISLKVYDFSGQDYSPKKIAWHLKMDPWKIVYSRVGILEKEIGIGHLYYSGLC